MGNVHISYWLIEYVTYEIHSHVEGVHSAAVLVLGRCPYLRGFSLDTKMYECEQGNVSRDTWCTILASIWYSSKVPLGNLTACEGIKHQLGKQ